MPPAASRPFLLICAAVAVMLVGACLGIAGTEWFSRDDFAFLAHVRSDDFRWSESFLPRGERFWHFYRPLGMEAYFRLCSQAFGLDASRWFAVSLAFHFASGWLLLGIARRLGFDLRAALAAALLLVSRPPALDQIFYGSVFHFVLSVFLSLVAVRCFLEFLLAGPRRWQLASLLALALALLTNGVNAVLPAVLLCAGLAARPPRRAAGLQVVRALLPHALLVGGYALLRIRWIPLVSDRAIYRPEAGLETLRKLAGMLSEVLGGGLGWAAAAAAGVGLLVLAAGSRPAIRRLGWRGLCLAGWAAAALAPFALLPFPQQRYAMLASAPVALLAGAVFDSAWRGTGGRRPALFEAAVALLVIAAIPFGVLAERATAPRGVHPLGLLRAVEARSAGLEPGARLIVLYGAPGLADSEAAIAYRYLTYNGTVLQAAHPETELTLRFQDLSQRPSRGATRPGAVYLQLTPELEIEDATPSLLARELPRGRGAVQR